MTKVKNCVTITKRCRHGGIGRHKGLKIPRRKKRTGSIPVAGTKTLPTPKGSGVFWYREVESNPSKCGLPVADRLRGLDRAIPLFIFSAKEKINANRFRLPVFSILPVLVEQDLLGLETESNPFKISGGSRPTPTFCYVKIQSDDHCLHHQKREVARPLSFIFWGEIATSLRSSQ